jgi:DNA-directed RNA polymerase subunit RPC12/RpoP
MDCLKCEQDVSDLMDWDSLCEKFIECPNCGNKMVVEYDESYNEEGGEDSWWWLEQYNENN